MSARTVVTVNSTGRQSASFVRVASAIGWRVRAHMHEGESLVAREISSLPSVTVFVGSLEDRQLIAELFEGAELAFINTTHWGDEVEIGRALADAAKRASIQHYIYSSMPDHSTFGRGWDALPLWASKLIVENYIREIGLPATFVYTGIYHNNFTSLPYPLFRLELQPDGQSFVWEAPFHPERPLPWLDAEHDMGPAVLQIFKQGPKAFGQRRITLAFAMMTPNEVCSAFARGTDHPVTYKRGPIRFEMPTPAGYEEHLRVLERVLCDQGAPYFGPELEDNCTREALELWGGPRSMEEYAGEAFIVEEVANGQTWMNDSDSIRTPSTNQTVPDSEDGEDYFRGSC